MFSYKISELSLHKIVIKYSKKKTKTPDKNLLLPSSALMSMIKCQI